ncbi:MAG TPA: alpha-L-glutamate ligase-like protein, partial [Pseudomonas sp.]|nr:alpha-L-glutamate ligase-like protein [Pseudomonas sp.]
VPDIRIIVLMGYPIMAMLRLPTRQSGGKANLHQGAIGVGV